MDDPDAFEVVLKAFAELRDRKFDCTFFLIGNGKAERRIRHRAGQLGLVGELTFADRQSPSQFTGIIKAADIYVSAAPEADLDLHSLLAMSAGSAVLSVPDPTADFLIDGRTALLFEPGDAIELTTKLVALLDDPESARSLAQGALEHVGAHHSLPAAARAVADVYRRAADERPPT